MYTVQDQVGHSLFLFCFLPWEISQVSWLGHVQGKKWIPQSVKYTFCTMYRVFQIYHGFKTAANIVSNTKQVREGVQKNYFFSSLLLLRGEGGSAEM